MMKMHSGADSNFMFNDGTYKCGWSLPHYHPKTEESTEGQAVGTRVLMQDQRKDHGVATAYLREEAFAFSRLLCSQSSIIYHA